MLIAPLDVIWIRDETITPPGPKMVVCIEPSLGMFFRINTNPRWQTPIKLEKTPNHEFLDHDSYLECGEPLELDDYIVDDSLKYNGIIGTISADLAVPIYNAVKEAKYISQADKEAIRKALKIEI